MKLRCRLCEKGFPLSGPDHIPTQRLGMIQVTRCKLADVALPYRHASHSSPGIEGCGESVKHRGELFFYRKHATLPRNGRVVLVKREWNFNHGTTAGDREFLAIAWNPEWEAFEVIDRSPRAQELYPLVQLKKLKFARETARSPQWRKIEPKIVLTDGIL